jgi:hypothetical protein
MEARGQGERNTATDSERNTGIQAIQRQEPTNERGELTTPRAGTN